MLSTGRSRSTHPRTMLARVLSLASLLSGVLMLLAGSAMVAAQDTPRHVTLLHVDGAITPVMATYIGRGVERAGDRGDAAVILRMDTPGGLSSSTDEIINDILSSSIPVIVYVAPEGARAASAGVYISYAAHIAAMAPVTNIGSATPIQLGESGDGEETALDRKIVNDAVARIRELAILRGRNADWAEQAVREAANIGAQEAVDMNVVNFIATDVDDLLAQADGMTVTVHGGVETTLQTAGASVTEQDMSFIERVLQVIVDPNIAFIFMSLGILGLIFELANPGSIFPGVVGAIMLVTGLYALGTLNANWTGFILIAFAFLLFVVEVFVVSSGLLTAGGVIAFLFGSLLLSNTRNDDVLQISRVLIYTVTALLGLFFFLIVWAAAKSRNRPVATGEGALIGKIAEARTDLNPTGMVYVEGELWKAVLERGQLEKGSRVRVTGVEDMKLYVQPLEGSEPSEAYKSEPEALRGELRSEPTQS